jgi:hypothetical protein
MGKAKHKKGVVFATISEGDLQRPDFFRMIGCDVHLGRPKKRSTTLDYAVILDLPKERTSFEVLNRMQEIGVGVISPHPIAGAISLVNLTQALKKKAPASAILVGQESADQWEELVKMNPTYIILTDIAHPFMHWIKERNLTIPIVLRVCPSKVDPCANLTHGVWIDASTDRTHSLEDRRQMGFNLLQTNP